MGLPELDRFTIEAVAKRWDKLPSYVEEMVRTLKFKYIIVKGEMIGGSPLTRHLYFDQALWIKDYGKKVRLDPASWKKEYEEIVKSQQAYLEKEFEEGVKVRRAYLEKESGATLGAKWEKEYRAKWEKEHGGKIKFNPTTLKKQYEEKLYEAFYNIGDNEVANLWQPFLLSKEWKRPKDEVVIYIPREVLEAFEQEHGLHNESNAEKAKKNEKSPAPDPSVIKPDGWYTPAQVARLLGRNKHYVQNNIDTIIRSRKLIAKRDGVHRKIQGKSLRDSLEKSDSDS